VTVDPNYFHDVQEFHRKTFGVDDGDLPPRELRGDELSVDFVTALNNLAGMLAEKTDEKSLRLRLILEELCEYVGAMARHDLVEQFDALLDLAYIIIGTADHQRFPFNAGWTEVHRSNMDKVCGPGRPMLRNDGKVMKPEGWVPPRLAEVLAGDRITVICDGQLSRDGVIDVEPTQLSFEDAQQRQLEEQTDELALPDSPNDEFTW
jgi:predicted HAD superfamily Cof-like phosphohydrolase